MKKKIINLGFILVLVLSCSNSVFSQVGIGISPPNTSAMLDVDVSSLPANGKKGFLPPRMDEAARDLIGTPATGLLIYNIDTNKLNYHDGSGWVVVEASAGFVSLTGAEAIDGVKTFNDMLIPEGRLMLPMGELSYFNTGGLTISLTAADTFVKVDSATGINFLNDVFNSGYSNGDIADFDGRLTYTGATTRLFHIALSFSFSPGANNDVFIFGVAKNGTVEDKSKVIVKGSTTTDNQSSAMHVALWLAQNDYIEFHVAMVGGTGTIVMKSFNFFAMGM